MVMEKNGSIRLKFTAPKRFTVVPIKELVNQRISEERMNLIQLEKSRNELAKEWDEKSRVSEITETYSIIESAEKVMLAVFDLRRTALKEICACNILANYARSHAAGMHDDTVKGEAKFYYRALTQLPEDGITGAEIYCNRIAKSKNAELRFTKTKTKNFPCYAIRDGEEVVLILTTKKSPYDHEYYKHMAALRTNNPTIVGIIFGHFDHLWNDSINVREILGLD